MSGRTAALLVVAIVGCAGPQRNVESYQLARTGNSPLYLGRSQNGQVVLAASHYDAMTGLATTDEDLGLAARKAGDGEMLCQREMPTGTHVPRWNCRYMRDMELTRQAARDYLDQPQLTLTGARSGLPTLSQGRGPGGGSRGSLTP
jgi:hypothetical protein